MEQKKDYKKDQNYKNTNWKKKRGKKKGDGMVIQPTNYVKYISFLLLFFHDIIR